MTEQTTKDLLNELPEPGIESGEQSTPLAKINAMPLTKIPDAGPAGVMQVIREAVASGLDKDTMLMLEGMHNRACDRLAKQAYLKAYAAFQAACPIIPKRGIGKFDRTIVDAEGAKRTVPAKYATLPDLMSVCEEHLGNHGLSLGFGRDFMDGKDYMLAILSHEQGHKEVVRWPIIESAATDRSPKHFVYAAASRFAQRYAALALLGIPDDELDPEDRGAPGGTTEPGPSIDADQVQAIKTLLVHSGLETVRFCKHFKVETVEDLQVSQYDTAVKKLQATIKRKGVQS